MMNEVNLRSMVECHRRFLDYMEAGVIEVIDPHTNRAMTMEQVIARIEEVGSRMNPGEKLKVDWAPGAKDADATQPNAEKAKELAETPEATGEDEVAEEEVAEDEVVGEGDPEGRAIHGHGRFGFGRCEVVHECQAWWSHHLLKRRDAQ